MLCFVLTKGVSSKGFLGHLLDQKNIIFFQEKRKNKERERGKKERMKKGRERTKGGRKEGGKGKEGTLASRSRAVCS